MLTIVISACATLEGGQDYSSPFSTNANKISVAERNAVIEALTNHEWLSTNKFGVANKYTFRVDDNGLIVSFVKAGTSQPSPEYRLKESPRGYRVDFPELSAYVKFWLTETKELARSVKIGSDAEDMYKMTPQARGEAYDDNIY